MAEQPPQARRKYYWGDTPEEQEYYNLQNIESTSSFYTTPRNLTLFTRSWLPPSTTPTRGVICMVHGYGNDHSWIFQSIPIFLAQNGFACFAADHGQSPGLKAFVPNVYVVLDDCISFFNHSIQKSQLQNLPKFLFGKSMGGAISLLINFQNPDFFNDAILIAPTCKISDKVRPRWPIHVSGGSGSGPFRLDFPRI